MTIDLPFPALTGPPGSLGIPGVGKDHGLQTLAVSLASVPESLSGAETLNGFPCGVLRNCLTWRGQKENQVL
jgi:hypothetical protein